MSGIKMFIERRPVLTYYLLTFVISWGGFLLVGGSGLLAGTDWQADPLFFPAVLAMLLGPPIAGILLTGIVSGKAGFRDLLSRLSRWRVGLRWYAVALVTAPLVEAVVLLALSRISPVFLPGIVKADDKLSLLLLGIAVGLVGGLVEELGWTGFAIPRLRLRHGVFAVGLIVGVLWGAWHLLQMLWVGSTSPEALSPVVFLPLYLLSSVASLTAYRVLMVRVYDRTDSLFVVVLMHASYIFSTLFVLAPPTTGAAFLVYNWIFAGVLWAVVAATALWAAKARRPDLRQVLLACGIVSSLLYIATDVLASLQYEGYKYTEQQISELMAVEAPTRAFMIALLVPYNLLLLAFAAGVWKSAGQSRALRLVSALFVAYGLVGLVGLLLSPMHARGVVAAMTLTDVMHIVATSVLVLLMVLFMAFAAAAFGTRFRIYSIATILVMLVFGALTGLQAPQLAANQPTPWMGVMERICIFAPLLWVAVLAVKLMRAPLALPQEDRAEHKGGAVLQGRPWQLRLRG